MGKRPKEGKTMQAIDIGTPERQQHGKVSLEPILGGFRGDQVIGEHARDGEECVLDRYLNRMQLVDRLHRAGIQMRKLWLRAAYPQATTSSYGEQRGKGNGEMALVARDALRKVLLASGLGKPARDLPVLVITSRGQQMYPVSLPLFLIPEGHVVLSVCGLDEWAGGAMRLRMLRQGLTMLADFWKIERG